MITATVNHKGEKALLLLMLLTSTVDYCRKKTDSWLHPVQGSAVDAFDTD